MTDQRTTRVEASGRRRLRQIGKAVRPLGWDDRTAGRTTYTADVELPGMLVGAILRSPHEFARIRSVSTRAALELPGVHAAVTAADFGSAKTYIHHGGGLSDRPPFARDVVRFIGQEVAAVAAEDRRTALEALDAIVVRYRRKRAPTTIEEALRPRSAALHPRRAGHNVSVEAQVSWGDVDATFAEAGATSAGTYRFPQVAHVSMEPHGTVAWWHADEGRLELWSSTQSPYFVRREVAHLLDLDAAQVVCRNVAVGGGFGAKSKVTEHEVVAALLSMRSGRPVKLLLSREEEFTSTKTRHEFRTSVRVAVDRDLHLAGVDAELLVDNGAYNHTGPSVMRAGLGMLGILYRLSAARARGRLVDTAKVPGGQFRGYGMPQVGFAVESAVDELARQIGVDPVELRIRSANAPDEVTLSGAKVNSAGLVACLERAREAIGWEGKKRNPVPGRGLGIAVAVHGSGVYSYEGADRSAARIEVDTDGRVRVRFGGSDPGTGQRTVLAQIVAEELCVDPEDVTVEMMDLSVEPADMGAWSSRGTHFAGNAAWQAAVAVADSLVEAGREKLGTGEVWLEDGRVRTVDESIPLGDLVAAMPGAHEGTFACERTFRDSSVDPTSAFEESPTANTSPSYGFAAHAVEVEVDAQTGAVDVLDYVAVHDAGRVLNPAQAEGQVIGGVVMGLGSALREELLFERGRVVNPAYLHYGVPRASDAPPVRVFFVGDPEPSGPFGAKNVGEISVIPVAPAVANAVRDAVGVRVRDLPITPDKIVAQSPAWTGSSSQRVGIWRRPRRWWVAAMRWAYPRGVEYVLHRYGTRLSRPRRRARIEEVEHAAGAGQLTSLATEGYRPVGGCTELQLLHRQGLSGASRLVTTLGVPELREVASGGPGGSTTVGAAVTLARLAEHCREVVPAVAEAVGTIATPQVRAVATVGGNLLQEKRCWFYRNGFSCYKRSGPASPCYAILGDHRFYHATMGAHRCQAVTPSDLATVFAALDAEVELVRGRTRRRLPVTDLYTGPGETCLASGEVLWSIHLPSQALGRLTSFRKLQLWAGDFAVTAVALSAAIDGSGVWRDVRLCLGGLAPTPYLARQTMAAAEGRLVTPEALRAAFEAEMLGRSHPLAGNAWKTQAAAALVGRAAADLLGLRDREGVPATALEPMEAVHGRVRPEKAGPGGHDVSGDQRGGCDRAQ